MDEALIPTELDIEEKRALIAMIAEEAESHNLVQLEAFGVKIVRLPEERWSPEIVKAPHPSEQLPLPGLPPVDESSKPALYANLFSKGMAPSFKRIGGGQ